LKKVLITGALGQNGKILSSIYLKKKFRVYGFIRRNKKKKIKHVNYILEDLKNKKKIIKYLDKIRPNIVIHLASINKTYSERLKKDKYYNNYYINLKITKNLVDAINEINLKTKFIFAGSSLMLNNIGRNKISEKSSLKSKDFYSKYKIDAYKYIKKNSKNNFFATTVILFNHDSIYRDSNFLIPKLIYAFKKRNAKFIRKIYNLNISGDFSHAEDICKGIYKISVIDKNIEKIILSSGKRFYLNSIIDFLEKKFDLKINKNNLSKDKKNFKAIGSNYLAKKILNYKSKKTPIDVCKEILKNYE
tara:strand:- start:1588 stop:2499 length:912 start_codon:yes stop_codon:yes gene_type:complete